MFSSVVIALLAVQERRESVQNWVCNVLFQFDGYGCEGGGSAIVAEPPKRFGVVEKAFDKSYEHALVTQVEVNWLRIDWEMSETKNYEVNLVCGKIWAGELRSGAEK